MRPKLANSGASNFWDILLVRGDGHWLGFRSPFESLQKAATYFVLLISLGVLSTTGWVVARWQVERLSRELSIERLRAASVEAQLSDLRRTGQGSAVAANTNSTELSYLPSLDAPDFKVAAMDISKLELQFDMDRQELSSIFDIVRNEPNPQSTNYYWVLLLHSARGVMALPSAFSSRSGELVLFHRGQMVESVKAKRSVSARFKVSDFVESSGADPVFGTLVLYDTRGSLMVRKRVELSMRRRGVVPGASRGSSEKGQL